jgi:hypothetical protein
MSWALKLDMIRILRLLVANIDEDSKEFRTPVNLYLKCFSRITILYHSLGYLVWSTCCSFAQTWSALANHLARRRNSDYRRMLKMPILA